MSDPAGTVIAVVVVAAALLLAVRARHRWGRGEKEARFFPALRAPGLSNRDAAACFVAVCQFDRFEPIRRNVGYAMANAILRHAAGTIRRLLPGVEIGRVDRTSIEFAFEATSADSVSALLCAIIREFERPIHVEGCDFDLSPRIGFAAAGGALAHEEAIERVEIALHDRANAHETVIDATSGPDEAATSRLGLLRDLHRAIDGDRLELHYQPKLRCRTDTVDSVEALLRWNHPELGAIRPDDFIVMAEETGIIRRLTAWTLARAVRDQRTLADAGHALVVYVNISGVLLPDRDFADEALALVAAAPGAIGFEITETAVIDQPEQAIANLIRFSAAGIRIAIDDYGSGLSSLAYLKQLPAHELKIDKLFISGLTKSHRDPLLVRSSIDLAHALEMEVTAEGVDDAMSLMLLRAMGCDLIQGFLVARPMALPALIGFLETAGYADRIVAPAFPRFGPATASR